jgi:hypothetical protein
LSIEADSLSAGVSLAFNITPQIQTVLSYDRTLEGFGPFESKDTAIGNTYGVALVYMH